MQRASISQDFWPKSRLGANMTKVLKFQVVSLLMLSVTALFFQNCGQGGFNAEIGNTLDQSSQGSLAAPQVSLSSPIPALSNSRTLSIIVVVSVAPSVSVRSVNCQLDSEPVRDCRSLSVNFTAIADGDHRLVITAEDSSGRIAEHVSLFRVDATAPVMSFSQAPAATTGDTSAAFIFNANDALSGAASIECSLDGAIFATCTSPVNLSGLAAGAHGYRIRGRDNAGNTSGELLHSWSIVMGAPVVTITQRPNAIVNATATTFAFNGTSNGQAISMFECSLDNGTFATCTSPQNYSSLAASSHNFRVRGRDQSGNFSSPVSYSWTIDTTVPPAPTLNRSITSSPTRSNAVTFTFSSTDASGIASYQCQLDGAAFASCTSPRALSSLSDGNHTFTVRAIDNAGNTSPNSTSLWMVDTVLPTVTLTQMPTASTTQTSANFSFTVSDSGSGVQSVECQLDAASYAACTTTASYSGLSLGNHTFNIRASDVAGNQRITSYSWAVTNTTTTTMPPVSGGGNGLIIDLSYVDQSSTQFQRFRTMVDAAVAGSPDYGFEPQHAALMYRITGQVSYCDYAIQFAETCPSRYSEAGCGVQGAETAIAAGQRPRVAYDSYLEVGSIIGSLAVTYDWCASRMTAAQRTRWTNYANQTIYNVWNYQNASWGGVSHPWTGWSVNNPGNNYYYSFVQATMFWALASRNPTMITMVRDEKLPPLQAYYAALPGGGSLEGTGYGAAHMNLFYLYQVWKDSTGADLANANSHLTDSIRFWMHATLPSRSLYAPIGDLSRSSYPDLFDYHRRIMLAARRLTSSSAAQDLASWWLNRVSVTQMSRRIDSQWDLIPAGTNPNATPNESLGYHAAGVGRVFARTGWDTNAMWMSFVAGPYNESHAHQDQGSFTLANNTWLAVTNNIYSASGINQSTDYHNVVRFEQNGAIIPQREGSVSTMTVNQLSATGEADITANLTPAFRGASQIQNWSRNISFNQRRLTVTDNFSLTAGTQGIFQIHVPVQPVISGNTVTAGNLRVRVISPGNATISVVSLGRYRIDIRGGTTGYVVELSDQ
jgi:hypothetical protein